MTAASLDIRRESLLAEVLARPADDTLRLGQAARQRPALGR